MRKCRLRRGIGHEKSLDYGVPRSCVLDEGRPLAAGLQDQAANRLELLW